MERETKKKRHWKGMSEVVYDAEGGVIWNNRSAACEPVTEDLTLDFLFSFYGSLCVSFSLRIALVLQTNVA